MNDDDVEMLLENQSCIFLILALMTDDMKMTADALERANIIMEYIKVRRQR